MNILKIVARIPIYVCKKCKLGFVDQKKTVKINLDKLYRLREYKKQRNSISSRLNSVINDIVRRKPSGSVLEIGPGHGLLSSLLLRKGDYELDIVEQYLMPYYLSGRPLRHHKTKLDQFLKINKRKFDLIIMFDVIEHLENPFSLLRKLRNTLKKEGILVIQTPNYLSLMRSMSKDWSWWMIEDHKWFFTPHSLKKALVKNGLRIVHERTFENWIDFKKNLDGNFTALGNIYIRRITKVIFFAIFIPLYFAVRALFWKMGKGGLLLVITSPNAIDDRDYHEKEYKNE